MKNVILFAVVFSFSLMAEAFIFTPMVKKFPPKGKGRVQTFYLENKKPEKVAVQITVFKRGVGENGEETRTPTDQLSVFPEQVILLPDQKRTVRVSWNGPEEVAVEEAFRLVAEQMPVELQSKKVEKNGISFLMKYVASIYILPEKAKSNVVLVKKEALRIKKAADKKNSDEKNRTEKTTAIEEFENQLAITLKNEGNAHQVLNGMWIEIKGKDKKNVRILGKDVKPLVSANLLPGTQRTFHLPWPKEIAFGTAEVEIGFNK